MNVGTLLVVWLADSVQYESLTFLDFDVLIESTGPETYQARVVNSPTGQTRPVAFRSPFSALELENFVLRIGPSRRRVRRVDSPEISTAKAFGGRLYQALFQGDLAAIFRESLSEADRRGAGVRLRLRLTGAPDLAAVPWEFLYDSSRNQFICLSERTPLIRFLEVANPPRPVAVVQLVGGGCAAARQRCRLC